MTEERRGLGLLRGLGRRQGRAQGLDPGEPHFALDRPVVFESQVQQERPQGEALQHEGAQHHPERRDEDQVAVGEGGAAVLSGRQREGGGEGHGAAHATPSHDGGAPRGEPHRVVRGRRPVRPRAAPPPAQGRRAGHPRDARQDHRRAYRRRNQRVARSRRAGRTRGDGLELEPHEDEREHVQHEDRDLPHRPRGDADARGRDFGRAARGGHREDDHGDDAGEVQPLGQHPHAEGAAELDHHRGRDVVDARVQGEGGPREGQPENDAAEGDPQQGGQGLPTGHGAGDRGRHRHPVDEERARVVEEALPFDDHQQPMRRSELLEHGGGRGRVGRGHDGAERDRDCPGQVGDEEPRDDRDHDDREGDRAEGETRHLAPVRAQVARRGVEGGVDQHGRDEQREGELGIQHEGRRAGDEREGGARERHQGRVGCADAARQRREGRAPQQERHYDLEHLHRASPPPGPVAPDRPAGRRHYRPAPASPPGLARLATIMARSANGGRRFRAELGRPGRADPAW